MTKKRTLTTVVGGHTYKIELKENPGKSLQGTLTSDAPIHLDAASRIYQHFVESIVFRHAINGVDVESEAYQKGFNEALADIALKLSE